MLLGIARGRARAVVGPGAAPGSDGQAQHVCEAIRLRPRGGGGPGRPSLVLAAAAALQLQPHFGGVERERERLRASRGRREGRVIERGFPLAMRAEQRRRSVRLCARRGEVAPMPPTSAEQAAIALATKRFGNGSGGPVDGGAMLAAGGGWQDRTAIGRSFRATESTLVKSRDILYCLAIVCCICRPNGCSRGARSASERGIAAGARLDAQGDCAPASHSGPVVLGLQGRGSHTR